MERAQLIKKHRGPAAGYRCRRCGEPKRGHICAARMMLRETPEGADLQMKAPALTEISAAALKTAAPTSDRPPPAQPPRQRQPSHCQPPSHEPARHAREPELLQATWAEAPTELGLDDVAAVHLGAVPVDLSGVAAMEELSQMPVGPTAGAAPAGPAATSAPLASSHHSAAPVSLVKSTSFAAASAALDSLELSSNVDDFLEQLRQALDHDVHASAHAPPAATPPPPLSGPHAPRSLFPIPAAASVVPPPHPPPPHPPCSRDCVRNTMPRLPVLTSANAHELPEWHAYIRAVYRESLTPDHPAVDLNDFTLFYRPSEASSVGGPSSEDAYRAISQLLGGAPAGDPCLRVCTLRSWPDRPRVFPGTVWVGDAGPEAGVGQFAFFVTRPMLTREAAENCDKIEVMHVRTEWLGGEMGVSWFFHAKGSGIFLDCRRLPSGGVRRVFRDRVEWREQHGWADWVNDDNIRGAMERDNAAMYIFFDEGFSVFNQAGDNPTTEIVVRHRHDDASELNSPRGSCLDGPGFGLQFTTGLRGSRPCVCQPSPRTSGVARLNCDGTAPLAAEEP